MDRFFKVITAVAALILSFTPDSSAEDNRTCSRPSLEDYRLTRRDTTSAVILALRSNLLLPLMNVGVEVPVDNKISLEADFHYPWIPRKWMNTITPAQKFCFQLLYGTLACRFWFRRFPHSGKGGPVPLYGHSAGISVSGGYFDVERNWAGRQGEFLFLGLDYLYSVPAGTSGINFEFKVGIGYGTCRIRNYDVRYEGGRLTGDGGAFFRSFPVPIRLGVNISFPVHSKKHVRFGEGRNNE